ncbi:MAG: rhodanese-like domain-containing protein, partial [Gammaproteobacteria bacterium]
KRMAELGDYLECPVAIVCRTDRMSVKAELLLTEEGFADVYVVRGGMTRWNEAGLPVIRRQAQAAGTAAVAAREA